MFSIGQTFHKHTLADNSHYPDVWDGRRGLSSAVKRASGFLRKEISSGIYETNFNLSDETQTQNIKNGMRRIFLLTGLILFPGILKMSIAKMQSVMIIWRRNANGYDYN
jgi:hypothetical protein